jgi:ComF family protein
MNFFVLLPRTCPLCHRPGLAPCTACAANLERPPALLPPPGVDRCVAVLAYEGAGRELVARLKYRNARSTIRWLATHMSALIDANDVDVVTWVPTTGDRRRRRGFDQAELLARAVARRLRRPCRRLLTRGDGPAQTGRSLQERRVGPAFAAKARGRAPRVLLVDDVITTGTTVTVAARTLRASGVDRVSVVAAARTPLKRH